MAKMSSSSTRRKEPRRDNWIPHSTAPTAPLQLDVMTHSMRQSSPPKTDLSSRDSISLTKVNGKEVEYIEISSSSEIEIVESSEVGGSRTRLNNVYSRRVKNGGNGGQSGARLRATRSSARRRSGQTSTSGSQRSGQGPLPRIRRPNNASIKKSACSSSNSHRQKEPAKSGEQLECTICLESLRQGSSSTSTSDNLELRVEAVQALPCAHVFHAACLAPWFADPEKHQCPICRFDLGKHN
ncbi:hypothetical protein NP233_g2989 [Leucocoprinus birnbaumii]|uniref:RING-type domain-containing protein n=1 Tax=Leucocoprinus birnbaumii TaxID=56174 RepID=A0AAD5VZ60_9AGAR|nr:hypothetical protein NP233_g2989 [Leucocoprinus birnbaumii]